MATKRLRTPLPGNPAVHRDEGGSMTSKNKPASSPSANRSEVVEAVVRRSGMTRSTVENTLSFLEQSGYRVVAGSTPDGARDE